MYFRQLRLPDIGCGSYIVGGDGVCVVVDPHWDTMPQYLGLARQQGFTVTHILETHTHADHVSGATRLAARTGATMPLKDVFGQPETMWMPFRRRLDRVRPYCRIVSRTETEVHDILLALERMYQPSFPELNLRQWTGSIYTWPGDE